jgi:hypothetical protein
LSNENIKRGIYESVTSDDDNELELAVELYENLNIDGTFTVYPMGTDMLMIFATDYREWPLLKRRILLTSLKRSGVHEFNKVNKINNMYVYLFDSGIHVDGIPDDNIRNIMLMLDCNPSIDGISIVIAVNLK